MPRLEPCQRDRVIGALCILGVLAIYALIGLGFYLWADAVPLHRMTGR